MSMRAWPRLRTIALAVTAAVHLALGAAGAPPSSDLPDLSAVRAKVYAGEYAKAVEQLTALSRTVQHAEVYNLLGYSLRQLKRYDEAGRWYSEALLYDPEHRPALEYQGELFLALGNVDAARKNLRYLQLLCTAPPCAEYELLKKAIAVSTTPSAAR
jgi:tetratricopeptide (TPR) repeat protein